MGIVTFQFLTDSINKLIKRVEILEKKESFKEDFKHELDKIQFILNRHTEELKKKTESKK